MLTSYAMSMKRWDSGTQDVFWQKKRKPFVLKRYVGFQMSFSPISLLTVCLGRCGPQCILVSLFFKNTTPGQSLSMSSRNRWSTMEIRNSLPFNTHFIQFPSPFQTPLFCLFSMLHHVCYGLYLISVTQTYSYWWNDHRVIFIPSHFINHNRAFESISIVSENSLTLGNNSF